MHRRLDASAAFGAGGWLVVLPALAGRGPIEAAVEAAVLLAVLVVVPLALPLAATPRRDGTHAPAYRLATLLAPGAGALVAASALLRPGPAAAALALPWVGVAGLLAAFGLWRLLARGLAPAEETLLDAGLLYLPVGALAIVAYRLDLGLGYGTTIIHLTAAHYHYATFLLAVVAAALGRRLGDRHRGLYRGAAAVLVVGVPLVAAGITASPALEAVAATAFAAAVVAVGALFLAVAREVRRDDPVAAGLLAVAGLVAAGTMALAVAYAVGGWVGARPIGVAGMVPAHGLANAVGLVLPAVLAWRRLAPPSRAGAPGSPRAR